MVGKNAPGPWVAVVVAILIIAPLASLSVGGAASYDPTRGEFFTYDHENEGNPTLFIGPERQPLATWEGPDGTLHLSQLSLVAPSKAGIPLSNLPRVPSDPLDGDVDIVATDADGVLHVVWGDGSGGVWHKAYDLQANVLVNNHLLSASDVMASAPAIAATATNDGPAAWITWIEEKDRLGTHLRLLSIDGNGDVVSSTLVDGILADLDPTACDVFVDTDRQPHVTFLGGEGAYWASPKDDGSFRLDLVHASEEGSLPLVLTTPEGEEWAVWSGEPPTGIAWRRQLLCRQWLSDGLGPATNVTDQDGADDTTLGDVPRASDLSTVLNDGPLAVLADEADTAIYIWPDGTGGIVSHVPYVRPTVLSRFYSPTVATDDRGQRYLAYCTGQAEEDLGCLFRVEVRTPDVSLFTTFSIDPEDPILIRPGTSIDVPVTVTSVVGYTARVQMGTGDIVETSKFLAEVVDDHVIQLDGGESARSVVRVTASMTAAMGTGATINIIAFPEGQPEALTSLDLQVYVPEHRPFIVRAPEGPVPALPGEPVKAHFILESWSDIDETVHLEVEAPTGWTVEVPEHTDLPAGGTVEVEVEVTAPEATPAGTEAIMGLGGSTDDGAEGAGTSVRAVVQSFAGIRLDLDVGGLIVMPGSEASSEAMVRNTGNEPVTVTILASPNHDDWSARVTPPTLTLTPGSEAPLLVWVNAPDGTPYGTRSRVMVVATSDEGPVMDMEYLTASVGHKVEYEVMLMPMSVPLMDGRAELRLELVNLGNAPEQVTLTFLGLPEDWHAKVLGASGPLILSPAETRIMTVTVTAPTDAPPGTVPIAVQVQGSKGPVAAWTDVHVANVFDVDVVIKESARTLTPPATVAFPFEMVSIGNTAGIAKLSLEGLPYGWDYAFADADGQAAVSFPLDTEDTEQARLSLKVPADAEGDTHALDLVLRGPSGDVLFRQTLFVRLRFPDLAVVDMRVYPLDPTQGTPLTVHAKVVNLGMADAFDVNVVLKEGTIVLDRDQLSIVPRMGELDVVLYMVPSQGTRNLVIEIDPANDIRELKESNNLMKRRVEVAPPPDEPMVTPAVAAASVAAIVTLSILGLATGTEMGRYALFSLLLIPLYTKIKKDRVLDHYLRGKIHGYIIANPGEHYNAIKDQLEVTNGALSYHLRVLEREGYVRSRMDGIYKRFYPSDMKLPTTQRNISSFQEVILTIVKNNQGLSQKEIAKRIGASSQVINYHIKIMEEGGLIRVDRTRRKSKVYATDAPTVVAAFD